ncbi:MAG TPA: hypothetical protein VF169_21560 [Albitalea sp.]|uniref:hypothetical protein n=1 Tax=Piscinibacter sp. TaxID=1903157 RepID=UPI002ED26E0E
MQLHDFPAWLAPVPPPTTDATPTQSAELLLQVREILHQAAADSPAAQWMVQGIDRWRDGGQLDKHLGLVPQRGQRAPQRAIRQLARDEAIRRLAQAMDGTVEGRATRIAHLVRVSDVAVDAIREHGEPPTSVRRLIAIIRG